MHTYSPHAMLRVMAYPSGTIERDMIQASRMRRAAALRSETGATMAEYALLIGGVALVVFTAAAVFGGSVRDLFALPAWLQ